MFKSGLLPAPIIQPLRYNGFGTKIKVDPNTFIQIKSTAPATKIFFTTDGTKPDPFQTGRTGKASTHQYIGPFRLQLGNRCVRAICVSRDKLRESKVATKYIDVLCDVEMMHEVAAMNSNSDVDCASASEDEAPPPPPHHFVTRFHHHSGPVRKAVRGHDADDDDNMSDVYHGSVEGPINPVNYSGTQINVWGLPAPGELAAAFMQPRSNEPTVGYLTEQMLRNLNAPKAPAIEYEKKQPTQANEFASLPETLRKLFKQLLKLYERDSDLQNGLDYLMENAQIKSADISESYDAFSLAINCPKFLPDEPPKPKPKAKPATIRKPARVPSPEVEIFEARKEHVAPAPSPPPPQRAQPAQVRPVAAPPPQAPKPKPVEVVKPKVEEKREVASKPAEPQLPSTYIEENQQQGTVVDVARFIPEKDAEALRKSVKGLGTNENVIVRIMGNRSNAQRLKIKDTYKLMFGRDLTDDLKDDTSGNFKKLLTYLILTPVEFDCMEIRKAIQGLGTDNSTLIEILTSRSNKRIKEISALYAQLYKKSMEDDIQSDTSGAYRKLLVSILSASRPETNEVDMNLMRKDVDELIVAGGKNLDETKFNMIFGSRSFAHLRQMIDEYQRRTNKTMEDSIKSEMSGNLAKTYLALIANIRNRPAYFAKQIKKAMKGLGTDEHTLNRIIVSRCEVDTKQIKEEYVKLFSTTIEKDISSDTSGDYKHMLLMLVKDPDEKAYDENMAAGGDAGEAANEEPHVIEQIEEVHVEETPTLVEQASGFNPQSDAERLRKAMKGLGTDEKTLIDVLCKRSNKQRQEIKAAFNQVYSRDLVKDLKSETSGDFCSTLEMLMLAPDELDAYSFHKAVKGFGTDETALVELLTTRSSEQINAAKVKYQSMYGKSLEKAIVDDTSSHFKHVLVSLLTALRPTGNTVDRTQAKLDAQSLLEAGEKKWGTDESKFVTILCIRSYSHLKCMFEEYEKLAGHSFDEALKKECSGDLLKVFIGIVSCVKDKQAYFATLLYKAMKGAGTKESVLMRVIVARCEIDMVQIKQKFEKLYNSKLADYLKGDVSGDFARSLFTLIGEESYVKK